MSTIFMTVKNTHDNVANMATKSSFGATKTPQLNFHETSLNNGLKCRKPVFIQVSGVCFLEWLYFGSIWGLE